MNLRFISKSIFICLLMITLHPTAWGAKEKIKLIAHGGVGDPFWSVVFKGAEQAAKDMDVKLQILYPRKGGDQPGTTQILGDVISTKPDGIAVTLATTAHCEYIKEARDKGISLVIFNAKATESSKKCPFQAYIGMDEYLAGKVSAKRALEQGKVKKRAVVGLTEPGHAGLQARARGIKEVLTKAGIKVDIIDLGYDASAIGSRIQGYWKRHQKELSSLFIPSPVGMHPILRLMQDDKENFGKLYAASFDLTPLIIKGIKDGQIDHTIDQQPYLQGYYSVAQLTLAIRGKFSPIDMNTGVGIVDQGNAADILKLVKKRMR